VEDEDGNGVRIYLLGMECSNISTLRIGCYSYTTASDVKSLDDVVDLPEHLIEVLKYNVISLGKFVLSTADDNINDGQDTTTEGGISRAEQLYQQQVTQQLQGAS
jgi:hypothetical protein